MFRIVTCFLPTRLRTLIFYDLNSELSVEAVLDKVLEAIAMNSALRSSFNLSKELSNSTVPSVSPLDLLTTVLVFVPGHFGIFPAYISGTSLEEISE